MINYILIVYVFSLSEKSCYLNSKKITSAGMFKL